MLKKLIEQFNQDLTPEYLISAVSSLLVHLVERNAEVPLPEDHASGLFASDWKYHWVKVSDYMDRLKEWVACGPESFVVAVCLLKRLEALQAIPPLTQLTANRVYFACLMLAVKMTEDETLNNADFAKVACVSLQELNELELYVLKALNFSCCVAPEEFFQTRRDLVHLDILFAKPNCEVSKLGFRADETSAVLLMDITNDLKTVAAPKRYNAANLARLSRSYAPHAAPSVIQISAPVASSTVDEMNTITPMTTNPPRFDQMKFLVSLKPPMTLIRQDSV
jgi:hypothetical protein